VFEGPIRKKEGSLVGIEIVARAGIPIVGRKKISGLVEDEIPVVCCQRNFM